MKGDPGACTVRSACQTERRLAQIAARQYRNVTLAQLAECGVGPGAVKYRVQLGRLHPVFRGVYAVGTPQDSRAGWFRAATLSVPGSAVSHLSAGQLWEVFGGRIGEIHLTCPRRLRDRARLRIHRGDVPTTFRGGIPTTTIEQTLVDMATVMYSERAYVRAVREALVQELTTYDRLYGFAETRAPGAPRLRRVLAQGDVRTRSRLEDDVHHLLADAGLPLPLTNERVHGLEVDMYWPDRGVVLEIDGPVHDNPLARAGDERRRAHLEGRGLTVVRVHHDEIGDAALNRLEAALDSKA